MTEFKELNEFVKWFHQQCLEMKEDIGSIQRDIEVIRSFAKETRELVQRKGDN